MTTEELAVQIRRHGYSFAYGWLSHAVHEFLSGWTSREQLRREFESIEKAVETAAKG